MVFCAELDKRKHQYLKDRFKEVRHIYFDAADVAKEDLKARKDVKSSARLC